MAVEDSNAKRRRELEEILELRRSFGTLGRRLVNRQTPVRPGTGTSLVKFLAQSTKANSRTDARPDEQLDRQPEPDKDQEPDSYPESNEEPEVDQELGHEPELDQEPDRGLELEAELDPEPEQPPERDQAPDLDQELAEQPEPEADQQPEFHREQRLDQEPDRQPMLNQELDRQPELDDELDREVDRVSTEVRRARPPAVDKRYRVQAPAARRRPWPWLVALVVVFALGMALGRAVLAPAAPRSAPPAATQATAAPSTPPSSTPGGSSAPRPQATVPPSCLATATLGDRLIDLLVKKTRGMEVTRALAAYTKASQNCRKEASSR